MKEQQKKYGPEDIETLLSSKAFDELYPEERSYVLEHISDAEEYERLRRFLTEVSVSDGNEPPISPSPELKTELMEAYAARHHQEKLLPWWRLNWQSLISPQTPRYAVPALAMLAIIVSAVLFLPEGTKEEMAVQHEEMSEEPTESLRPSPPIKEEDRPISTEDLTGGRMGTTQDEERLTEIRSEGIEPLDKTTNEIGVTAPDDDLKRIAESRESAPPFAKEVEVAIGDIDIAEDDAFSLDYEEESSSEKDETYSGIESAAASAPELAESLMDEAVVVDEVMIEQSTSRTMSDIEVLSSKRGSSKRFKDRMENSDEGPRLSEGLISLLHR